MHRYFFAAAVLLALPATAQTQPPFASALLAGLHAERQKDSTAAADAFARALALDPMNRDLQRRAFMALALDGRWTDAVPLAERASADGANIEAALLRALVAARTGDAAATRSALDAVDAATVMARGEGDPRRQQTRLIAARLATGLARAWVEGAARTDGVEPALAEFGDALAPFRSLHIAMIRDWTGNLAAAEAAYRSAASGARPGWRIASKLGHFLERQGRGVEATEIYQTELQRGGDPDLVQPALARARTGQPPAAPITTLAGGMAEAFYDLASLLQADEAGHDLALLFVRYALFLRPDDPVMLFLLGDVIEDRGQRAAANTVFAAIPQAAPVRWSARLKIAANRAELGDVDGAAAELSSLAAERTDRYDPLARLGDLYRSKERWAEAITAYDGAMQRIGMPTQRHWFLLFTRGIALERSKNWPRAEADFKQALALQPDQPMVLNYLGYSWIDQGVNLDEGKRMVERAVELRPRDGHIVDSLGWAYYRLGDYPKAVEWLERAVELKPTEAVILDHLGDALWKVGRQLEARFQWRRALSFDADAELRAQIDKKLANGL